MIDLCLAFIVGFCFCFLIISPIIASQGDKIIKLRFWLEKAEADKKKMEAELDEIMKEFPLASAWMLIRQADERREDDEI